jgi:hypothetical protein
MRRDISTISAEQAQDMTYALESIRANTLPETTAYQLADAALKRAAE